MPLSAVAFTSIAAPLIVAAACLVAWSRLDSGRHLIFWALGHFCLAVAFGMASTLGWRGPDAFFPVTSAMGVLGIAFLTAGVRQLVGRQDSLAAVLSGAVLAVATAVILQMAGEDFQPAGALITAALLGYGGLLLLYHRQSPFYVVAGIILLVRCALSGFYAQQIGNEAASVDDTLTFSALINLTTGLCLIMIEFDNARRAERRAREAQHDSTQFLQTLLDAMPATMSYKDRDLRYRLMNRRMRELGQADNTEHIGRTWSEIAGPDTARVVEDIDRHILATGESTHMEQAWTGPDGRPIVLWALKVPLRDSDGRIMGIITCGIDISRLKETEAQLIEQREAAESASRAKSTFLSNMSHELRTPLNAIIGFAQMLAGGYAGPLTERQIGYAANIQESGEHLLRLVNDILDLSRLESGRLDVRSETCSFDHIAQNALAMVLPQARQAEITLSCPPTGLALQADPRALTQILVNLLGNAVKFNRPQGNVHLEAEQNHGVTCIRVRDDGIGMSEAESRVVSQPLHLHRSDVYRTRPNSGAGLGLSICRSLVELHGGRLEIRSRPGEGTTVEVFLPT